MNKNENDGLIVGVIAAIVAAGLVVSFFMLLGSL